MLEYLRYWLLRYVRWSESLLLTGTGWQAAGAHSEFVTIKSVRIVLVAEDAAAAMIIVQQQDGSHRMMCVVTEVER